MSLRRLGDPPDPHKQGLAGSWQAIASASGPLRWPSHYSTRYLLRGKGLQQVPRGAKARNSFDFREWGTEDEREGGRETEDDVSDFLPSTVKQGKNKS